MITAKRLTIISIILLAPVILFFSGVLGTKNDGKNPISVAVRLWFDSGANNCETESDLHKCSQWSYLSEQEFSEMVSDGLSKVTPPLKDSNSIFELGMGVGAAIKVMLEETPNIQFAGSDFSDSAIETAKEVFPEHAEQFFVHNMIYEHTWIEDNTYDHVFSFGALGMYLTQDEMVMAVKEAVRITKPGGSLLFTHFIEPGAKPRNSIVAPVEKAFWIKELPELGVEDIRIEPMKHQGERYQILCRKKKSS